METKLSKLRAAAAADDWEKALSIAAKFQRLGGHKAAIVRAHEAVANPGFYAQIGKDPTALFDAGISALRERYEL